MLRRSRWGQIAISVVSISLSTLEIKAKNHAATTSNDLVFDEPFIDKAIFAAELSLLAHSENPMDLDGDYTFFEALQEGDNRAIVAKRDDTCYAAYSSENYGRLEEIVQRVVAVVTLDFDNFSKLCFSDCCKVRSPVERLFDSLHAEVEPVVEACRQSCGETTPCPLILTGHHQGGAVAYTAGLQFAYANPTGYTFGAPQVFAGGCKALDSTQWYRFVNSRESQHRREVGYPPGGVIYDFVPLSYDVIPSKGYHLAKHIGYQLTLALDYTIANLGLDANKSFTTMSGIAGSMTIENPDRYKAGYLDRLYFIRDVFTSGEESFPVPDGYYQRDICTLDEECQEGLLCLKLCPLCPPRCDPPKDKKQKSSL